MCFLSHHQHGSSIDIENPRRDSLGKQLACPMLYLVSHAKPGTGASPAPRRHKLQLTGATGRYFAAIRGLRLRPCDFPKGSVFRSGAVQKCLSWRISRA